MQRRDRGQSIERRKQSGRHAPGRYVVCAAVNDTMATGCRLRQFQIRDSLERRVGSIRSVLERAFFVDENLSVSAANHKSAAAQADFIRDAFRDERLIAVADLIESELARRRAAIQR